ncbi:response regulator [Yasminevirus sp. GU-2018]|uniref:Response regulator n=1 Tax=Yasminevirus sp. GU-2018 TaxID=2420051 RepID=A0A5K0U8U8_9VIRU|nr:response regulator [Yasminevirus sp. GU-2018]
MIIFIFCSNSDKQMYKTKISDPEQRCRDAVSKLNILIVDDDKASRDSLADMIRTRGHDVTTLDEGMKCVNRCSKTQYDIIFMDYHMDDLGEDLGELDGATVTQMVRDCFDVDAVVYAYTGDNTPDAIKQFKENNMKGVFVKPVESSLITEFLKIVEKNGNDQSQLSKLAMKRRNFMFFKTKSVAKETKPAVAHN